MSATGPGTSAPWTTKLSGRARLSTAVLMAALTMLLALPPGAGAVMPGDNGQIAFTRTDNDGTGEVYVINSDGSGETNLTDNPAHDHSPAWSPDGSQLLFVSDRDPGDVNDGDLYRMNPDGTGITRVTVGARAGTADWSPDGTRIVFTGCPAVQYCETFTVDSDGGTFAPLCPNSLCSLHAPSWSPYGEPIAFSGIETVNSDGTGLGHLSNQSHSSPDWAPDYSRLVAMGFICSQTCTGGELKMVDWPSGTLHAVPGSVIGDHDPVFSPDGTRLAFVKRGDNFDDGIVTMRTDGTERAPLTAGPKDLSPDWQTLNPAAVAAGYARPKAATPLSASLVVAYGECTPSGANRVHGPPLAYPSCSLPGPSSPVSWLTVGTADSNGAPTRFLGTVSFTTVRGNPATPADEADVAIKASLTDVRCRFGIDEDPETEGFPCRSGAMTDYTGEVQVRATTRITDKLTTGGRTGTVQDIGFEITVPCSTTPTDVAGSTCAVTTTMESVVPGAVAENARSIWELGPVEVMDGGLDGNAETTGGNEHFATQGIFVP